MALRFAGQETALSLIDSTTGDALLADMAMENVKITFPFELTKMEFLGELGPDYREFGDGAEVTFKFMHTDAAQTVTACNAMIAKAQGKSNDEFALGTTFTSPDRGAFRVVLRDLHFEGVPLDMSGRTEFLESEITAKCKTFKIATV